VVPAPNTSRAGFPITLSTPNSPGFQQLVRNAWEAQLVGETGAANQMEFEAW